VGKGRGVGRGEGRGGGGQEVGRKRSERVSGESGKQRGACDRSLSKAMPMRATAREKREPKCTGKPTASGGVAIFSTVGRRDQLHSLYG